MTGEAEVFWVTLRLPQEIKPLLKQPWQQVAKDDDMCSTATGALVYEGWRCGPPKQDGYQDIICTTSALC